MGESNVPGQIPGTRGCSHFRCPRGDSNAGIYLRRVALYPLSYGGSKANSTTAKAPGGSDGAAGVGDLASKAVDGALGLGLDFGSQPRQLIFLEGQLAQ